MISWFICCRAGEVGSLDLSRALIFSNISAGTGSVLIRCRPEGICRDAAFRMMVRKIFSPFWQFDGSRLLFSLSSISLLYRSQFAFFRLKLVRWGMGLIVWSICKLMRIGRWSEPRFVCQLVEVIREADANETSGEDGLALPGSLVGESEVFRCQSGPHTELQTVYTQYKDEGGHTQQSSAEIGKLEVGHKCKHDQNHIACFMLFRR